MKVTDRALRAPIPVQTPRPEAVRALEDVWRRQRRELAGWRPSGGWLLDSRALQKRLARR